jgi:ABC-type multidrug transport system fused ATPase/permease subunit
MNAIMKPSNNTANSLAKSTSNNGALNTISSFVSAPVNSMKNMATNTANSLKNTLSNDIVEPINESISSSFESNTSPFVSIPVIISLGIFVVLFIIIVIFREQITHGLERAWQKLKELVGYAPPTAVEPPPPPFVEQKEERREHHRRHNQQNGPSDSIVEDVEQAVENILPGRKEVFNIAQDKYTYSDAEPLCKAFGAELATYDQVKEAWKQGADWCNYGWVKGQSAVYPTQESTYNKLQAGPEDQRGACGVTGINGGFFDNPEMRFGVNCYGKRPSENEADTKHIMAKNSNLTPDALAYDKKVQGYKQHKSEIAVNPFKSGAWSS